MQNQRSVAKTHLQSIKRTIFSGLALMIGMIALPLLLKPMSINAQEKSTATFTPTLILATATPTATPTITPTSIPTLGVSLEQRPSINVGNAIRLGKLRSWEASPWQIDSLVFTSPTQLASATYEVDGSYPIPLTLWTLDDTGGTSRDDFFESADQFSTNKFSNLRVSTDGTRLIAIGDHIAIWDTQTGAFISHVAHAGAVTSTSDQGLIVGGYTGLVSVWRIPPGRPWYDDGSLDNGYFYNPSGVLLTAFRMDEAVNQIEAIPNSREFLVLTNTGRLDRYALDGNLNATGITVSQDATDTTYPIVVRPEGGPRMALNANRSEVAYAGPQQDVVIYNYDRDETLGGYELDYPVTCLTYSPAGDLLLIGSVASNTSLYVLDAVTLKEVTEIKTNENVTTCAFNTDGTLIATGNTSGQITLWGVP